MSAQSLAVESKVLAWRNMTGKLPHSTNRTALAPNAPKATPERMKEILEALRKNQKKQTEKQEESA
ncbi:hypothetical protein AB4145_15165 [Vibrio splendidus]